MTILQDFLPKLKDHLLERILRDVDNSSAVSNCSPDAVLLKQDRMYQHQILRTNYTTYDIRHSQDVVNASTLHHNVMVLADQGESQDEDQHLFRYARVLGVYHINAVYIGPGMVDYQPRRMEFLWVRWYQVIETANTGWCNFKLDCVQFPPVAEEGAFGFIDPSDVLRGCHMMPSFARGKVHLDGRGLSLCAHDSGDWAAYYVNR